MIKIDTNEIDKFAVELIELSEKSRDNVQKAIKKSAFNIEANAKKNLAANKSVVTGHLRRSIATKMGDLEATIHTSNVKYAVIVEKGSKAHIIRPKNKKALYWKGAKRPVKLVNHPGSKAKPYLEPAFESEKDKFIENLKEAIKW
jgi:HK97 gp10 family phage protein